jgi:hypothetical protein
VGQSVARDISKGVAGEFNATRNRNISNIQSQREAKMGTGEVIFVLLIFLTLFYMPRVQITFNSNNAKYYFGDNPVFCIPSLKFCCESGKI